MRNVLGEALGLTAAEVAAGVITVLFLSRSLKSLFYGITGFDPLTYAVLAGAATCAALPAAYQPARWARRIDPAMSLRPE